MIARIKPALTGSKEAPAPTNETPDPLAAAKENLPKPDDNPLAGLLSSSKLSTHLIALIQARLHADS